MQAAASVPLLDISANLQRIARILPRAPHSCGSAHCREAEAVDTSAPGALPSLADVSLRPSRGRILPCPGHAHRASCRSWTPDALRGRRVKCERLQEVRHGYLCGCLPSEDARGWRTPRYVRSKLWSLPAVPRPCHGLACRRRGSIETARERSVVVLAHVWGSWRAVGVCLRHPCIVTTH